MHLQSHQKSLGGEGSIVSCRHYDQPSHKKELMLQFQVRRVKGFRGVLFHIMICYDHDYDFRKKIKYGIGTCMSEQTV